MRGGWGGEWDGEVEEVEVQRTNEVYTAMHGYVPRRRKMRDMKKKCFQCNGTI